MVCDKVVCDREVGVTKMVYVKEMCLVCNKMYEKYGI